jgi:tripartite ATP-independent transporter DctP family solute receptor
MKSMGRKGQFLRVLVGCLVVALMGFVSTGPSWAEVEMTIATFHPRTGTADVEGLYHYKELVEKQTGGEIKVKVFYGGTLGGERELVEQLKLGTVHLCLGGWGTRGAYITKIMPWGIPYLFSSKEEIEATIKGRIGKETQATYLKNGIVWNGVYFRGNRQLTTNRNVKVPEDLKGMKIRLPETPDWLVVWKAFGCLPTPIPSPEIFGALQTGVVEAQENPISSNFNRKLWEVQKYTVMTNHIVDIQSYLLSKQFVEKLNKKQQDILVKASVDTMEWCTKFSFDEEDKLIKQMKDKGMTFLYPDLKPFKKVALGTMDYFKKRWEPWVYEETMKTLGQ